MVGKPGSVPMNTPGISVAKTFTVRSSSLANARAPEPAPVEPNLSSGPSSAGVGVALGIGVAVGLAVTVDVGVATCPELLSEPQPLDATPNASATANHPIHLQCAFIPFSHSSVTVASLLRTAVERGTYRLQNLVHCHGAVAVWIRNDARRQRSAPQGDVDRRDQLVDRDGLVQIAVTGAERPKRAAEVWIGDEVHIGEALEEVQHVLTLHVGEREPAHETAFQRTLA